MSRTTRAERRRLATSVGAASSREWNPDYGYIRSDLRRIGVLAAGLLGLLVVLALLLN